MLKSILSIVALIIVAIVCFKLIGFVIGTVFSIFGLIIVGGIGYFLWTKKKRVKKLFD